MKPAELRSLLYLPGPNCRPAVSGLHMRGGTHVLIPFGKEICPPGGSSGASHCPGQSRDQAVGKCLPWLCHPLRCCFPWHQMRAEIGSRMPCNFLALCITLFSLQHLHLFLLSEPGALHKGDCYNFFPSHTGLLLMSARKACSDHKKPETGCRNCMATGIFSVDSSDESRGLVLPSFMRALKMSV